MFTLSIKGEQADGATLQSDARGGQCPDRLLRARGLRSGSATLSAALQPVLTFAYATGWRLQSEILPLQWRQVDLKAATVTLDPGTTKNREGRTFPFGVIPTFATGRAGWPGHFGRINSRSTASSRSATIAYPRSFGWIASDINSARPMMPSKMSGTSADDVRSASVSYSAP